MRPLARLLGLAAALAAGEVWGLEPKGGGTIVVGRGGDSVGLDPGHETDGESYKVCDNLYDTLVQFRLGTTEVQPSLAERWEISKDGKSYTFHLRKGVAFHDGSPFDADAVVFSLERQRDASHPFHGVGGAWKFWAGMSMSDIVAAVRKVDAHTVRVELKKPEAPFLANLAMNFSAIVSPAAVAKQGEDFRRNPSGTGPFRFVRWVKDQEVVLEANPVYWGGRPFVDKVIFRCIPDNTVRFLEMMSGTLDVMDLLNPEDLPKLEEKKDKFKALRAPGMDVAYLAMNCDRKPFGDARVRRAVSHAINRKAVLDNIYLGLGVEATNPIPPTMWGHDPALASYGYDPARAKRLLAEAGLPNGFSCTLYAMPVPRPYCPDARKVAVAMQQNLAEVGIKAEIVSYEWGTYLEKTNHGDHDMAIMGWTGDNGDPDNFYYTLLSKDATTPPAMNIAFYRSDELQKVLLEAKRVSDVRARTALYKRAAGIFHRDAPWVPIAHSVQVLPTKMSVMDMVLEPTGKRRFAKVWLNR